MPGTAPASTFIFADLAGYTALTEAMGDEHAAELAASFGGDAAPWLEAHDAHQIKTIGDALMLRAGDATQAIRLGLALARDVGAKHNFPAVRVGMHTGTAIERDGDWFGATVNLAARVAALARGGEVLLTATTAGAADELDDVEFADRGLHQLRHVGEPVHLLAAVPRTVDSPALPLDPVCHMAVDPARCANTLEHDGREYHFCSLDCAALFARAPERYAGA